MKGEGIWRCLGRRSSRRVGEEGEGAAGRSRAGLGRKRLQGGGGEGGLWIHGDVLRNPWVAGSSGPFPSSLALTARQGLSPAVSIPPGVFKAVGEAAPGPARRVSSGSELALLGQGLEESSGQGSAVTGCLLPPCLTPEEDKWLRDAVAALSA